MNKQRRTEVKSIIARLRDINCDLSEIQSEEQCSYDNIPEGLSETDAAMASEEAIDAMDDASEQISEAIDRLTEVV